MKNILNRGLTRALGLAGAAESSACEQLESRALMDAVTASLVGHQFTADAWDVAVRYSAPSGINLASIDGNDMGANGPAYARHGRVVIPGEPQADGSVIVQYRLDAPGGQWSWDRSGTYRLGLAAGQVRSTAGGGNAATGLGSFYHVFWNPIYRLTSPNSRSGNDQFETRLPVTVQVTPPPWAAGQQIMAQVDVVGPHGFNTRISAQTPLGTAPVVSQWGPTTRYTFAGEGVPPGGRMDPTDNGRYDYRLVIRDRGVERGSTLGASFFLWWGVPGGPPPPNQSNGITLVSSELSAGAYTVTVRYASPSGIDVSSLGSDDLRLQIRKPDSFFLQASRFYQDTSRGFELVSYQRQSDGSVVANYRATPLSPGGWSRYETGVANLVFASGSVRSNGGTSWESASLETQEIWSTKPAAHGLSLWSSGPSTVEFSFRVLDIDDEFWQYDPIPPNTPLDQYVQVWLTNIGRLAEVVGPGGQRYTPMTTYFGQTPFAEQPQWRGWNVRMSITLPGIATPGTYELYLRDGALRVSGGSSARVLVGNVQF